MMLLKKVEFIIPGAPVPKERPRVTKSRTYTPTKTKNYQKLVKWYSHVAMKKSGYSLFEKSIDVYIDIYFDFPAFFTDSMKTRAANGKIRPHTDKRDISNIAKAIEDGMNKIVYNDDKQICLLRVNSRFDDRERVHVTVWGEVDRY